MTPQEQVLRVHPDASCIHVPMSIAVAIYVRGKMIGAESIEPRDAWRSAAQHLSKLAAAPEVSRG